MSLVNTYNINVHQGETWSMSLQVKDDDGNPMNLSGYSAVMEIRDKPGGKLYKKLSTTGGEIVITGATGDIAYSLTAAETAALAFKDAYYDTYIKSGSDTITYLLKGIYAVCRRVSE